MFIYLIILNLISFIIYGIDKRKSIKKEYRISEYSLFVLSFFGGGLGSLLGMKVFHHKTKKPKFYVGVPVILIIQIVIIILYETHMIG